MDPHAELLSIASRLALRRGFVSPDDALALDRRDLLAALTRQDALLAELAARLREIARALETDGG